MFILVASSDETIIQRLKKSTYLPSHAKLSKLGRKETWLSYSGENDKSDSLISKRSVNDLNDYSHDTIQNNLIKHKEMKEIRSILSVAYCRNGNFICQSDIWGAFPFFWTKSKDHFIVSDNLFLVAHLVNSSVSESGFYETLFFSKPKNSNTFYSNISATLPGQSIVLNYFNDEVFISDPIDIFKLLNVPSSESYVEKYNDIVKAFSGLNNLHISLSAGSDSTTLLAALLFNNIKPSCHSWGDKQYLELKLIKGNIKRLGLNWSVTSFENMFDNYREMNKRNTFITNGNNHTMHHAHYYSFCPNIYLFEGYLGSEFVKGELSDGMYTTVMKDILTGEKTTEVAIQYHFSELNKNELHRFTEYIMDNYGNDLSNANTENGLNGFKAHLFTFLPSKVFSPLLHHALNNNIKLYWPNFDIEFLRSVYSAGYGLMNMASIRTDYSEQKSLQPLLELNKAFKSPLMKTPLDRNVAFKDVDKPEFQYKIYKRLNQIKKRLVTYKRNLIFDQVDYRRNKEHLSVYLNDSKNDWILQRLSKPVSEINSTDVQRAIIQYAMIQDIDNCY
jgi:hypothetical protein